MIPGHILRDSDLVCLSWDRGIRAFQSTYDTGIYNEKSIFGPCLILGTELLKPLGFPMWNFLLLFITGSFQSHLSFCYWGDFWKAPRVESCCQGNHVIRGLALSAPLLTSEVQGASGLLKTWGCWESGFPREAMEALHLFSIPCPIHFIYWFFFSWVLTFYNKSVTCQINCLPELYEPHQEITEPQEKIMGTSGL